MELILWRHAEADEAEPDMARALTAKGQKQAWKTAEWLDRHLPASCRIYASPAVRTVQTAETLGRKFKIHADLSPGSPPEKLLSVAGWPESRDPVLLIGHQPTLGMVASLLITGQLQQWSVKKSSVWWIAQKNNDDGDDNAYMRAIITPEFLTK